MSGVRERFEEHVLRESEETTEHVLAGSIDGVAVTVRFMAQAHGSITVHWTEIEAPYTPGTTTMMFAIRPALPSIAADVRNGLMRDLEIGDAEFDRAYVVEAAPSDVVRELFDADVRRRMLEAASPAIYTREKGLVVRLAGWVEDAIAIERMALLAVDLVRRIEPAMHAAAERQRNDPAHVTYRRHVTADDIARARAADIEALVQQSARRTSVTREPTLLARFWFYALLVVVSVIVTIVVGTLALFLASRC